MKVTDFNLPMNHPFGMLQGYRNAAEKEYVLMIMLRRCLVQNSFAPVELENYHPSMVEDGLLTEFGEQTYELTIKAIGLLYTAYGKKPE